MLIGLLTGGTRGDIQPFVALGVGLKEAGYNVRVIAPRNFRGLAEAYGLEFVPLAIDIEAMMRGDAAGSNLMLSGRNPIRLVKSVRDLMKPFTMETIESLQSALDGVDFTVMHVVISNMGITACDRINIPYALASPAPTVPTGAHPFSAWPFHTSLGKIYNRLTGWLFMFMFWQVFRRGVNTLRERYGLKRHRFRDLWEIYRTAPSYMAISPTFYERPADYPDSAHVPGYWILPALNKWQPPDDLVEFINAGKPPIYAGFGSMVPQNQEQIVQAVIDFFNISGERGLIYRGWADLHPDQVPDNVKLIDSVPFEWLFPQMKAVIHHGGAGTTAAGVRAGVPSVIVPFIADQPFWGRLIYKQRIGSWHIPAKRLNGQRLAKAVRFATQPHIQANAAAMGEAVRAEDGITQTIQLIEQHLDPTSQSVASVP
jgi:sterol 3beta-glucosyltransferase